MYTREELLAKARMEELERQARHYRLVQEALRARRAQAQHARRMQEGRKPNQAVLLVSRGLETVGHWLVETGKRLEARYEEPSLEYGQSQ